MAHAAAFYTLSNGFVALSSVPDGDFNVSVLHGFRTHINNKFVGHVDFFQLDLNHEFVIFTAEVFLVRVRLSHFCSSNLCQFALP